MLIVEDDESSRNALNFLLTSSGWEVAVAHTLAEAFDQIKKQTPDSMVLDLMLPDGDGTLLLQYIRDKSLKIPVAVTTGVHDPDWLKRVHGLGPVCVLQKPISLSQLIKVL